MDELKKDVIYHVTEDCGVYEAEWLVKHDKDFFVHLIDKGIVKWNFTHRKHYKYREATNAEINQYEACIQLGKFVSLEDARYWKYVRRSCDEFTKDKVYKTTDDSNVNDGSAFIDNVGDISGCFPENLKYFTSSTKAEYDAQNQQDTFEPCYTDLRGLSDEDRALVGEWYERKTGEKSVCSEDYIYEYKPNTTSFCTHESFVECTKACWSLNKEVTIEQIRKELGKETKIYLDDVKRPLKEFKVGSWYTNPLLSERTLKNGNTACFFKVKSCERNRHCRSYYYNKLTFNQVADSDWNIEDACISQANTDYDQEMVEVFPDVKSQRYIETMKFFEQLREPERSEAIANYDEDFSSIVPETIEASLNHAFQWCDSKQGLVYWDNIHRQLVNNTYFNQEVLVFGKYKIGDIVVFKYLHANQLYKITPSSTTKKLNVEGGYHDITPENWRAATPEEVEAYNQGVRNIKDIKPKDKWAVLFTNKTEREFVLKHHNPQDLGLKFYVRHCITQEGYHGQVDDLQNDGYTILSFIEWCDKFGYTDRYYNEIFEEACHRYPVGTMFKIVHHPDTQCTVKSHVKHEDWKVINGGVFINLEIERNDESNLATVWRDGKWAEIVEPEVVRVPDEIDSPTYKTMFKVGDKVIVHKWHFADITRDLPCKGTILRVNPDSVTPYQIKLEKEVRHGKDTWWFKEGEFTLEFDRSRLYVEPITEENFDALKDPYKKQQDELVIYKPKRLIL